MKSWYEKCRGWKLKEREKAKRNEINECMGNGSAGKKRSLHIVQTRVQDRREKKRCRNKRWPSASSLSVVRRPLYFFFFFAFSFFSLSSPPELVEHFISERLYWIELWELVPVVDVKCKDRHWGSTRETLQSMFLILSLFFISNHLERQVGFSSGVVGVIDPRTLNHTAIHPRRGLM